MPQILILDRHMVTISERIKAKQICENEYGLNQGSKKASRITTKFPSIIKYPKGDGFSKGETDLYREMAKLDNKKQNQEIESMERTKQFFKAKTYEGIPVPTKKKENKDKFGQNTED